MEFTKTPPIIPSIHNQPPLPLWNSGEHRRNRGPPDIDSPVERLYTCRMAEAVVEGSFGMTAAASWELAAVVVMLAAAVVAGFGYMGCCSMRCTLCPYQVSRPSSFDPSRWLAPSWPWSWWSRIKFRYTSTFLAPVTGVLISGGCWWCLVVWVGRG